MLLRLLADAMAAGASLSRACEVLGLDCRTVQRWTKQGGGDDRRRGPTSAPRNKLTAEEDARLLAVANSPEFRDQSPRQIIPKLASRGQYIASEAHLYRLLRKHGLLVHRSRTRPPTPHPRALTATGPNQVYSWDITYLRSPVRGVYFYLYMVVDIWSRRIVAWEVHDRECGDLASALVERICQSCTHSGNLVWLHSDNGAPMKSAALLATLRRLGIQPSFSRPRVSNDNPYSEALPISRPSSGWLRPSSRCSARTIHASSIAVSAPLRLLWTSFSLACAALTRTTTICSSDHDSARAPRRRLKPSSTS